jgi:four helix bundle protein
MAMAPDDGRGDAQLLPGYQRLTAWQKAMELVKAVYQATCDWPRQEQFGLTNQVRRAAVSIPSNIAEGHGRSGSQEYAHHLSIAYGSLCELETQLLIAKSLNYSDTQAMNQLLNMVAENRRFLLALLKSIRLKVNDRTKPRP